MSEQALLRRQAEQLLQDLETGKFSRAGLSQRLAPTLVYIGNQNPSLIEKHIKLLASLLLVTPDPTQVVPIIDSLSLIANSNPAFETMVDAFAKIPLAGVLTRIQGIDHEGPWATVSERAGILIDFLNSSTALIPDQVHVSDQRPFDHLELFARLILQADTSIRLVDPFIGDDFLSFLWLLRKVDGSAVYAQLLTRQPKPDERQALEAAVSTFAAQTGRIELRYDNAKPPVFHNRWLEIDDVQVWDLGTSIAGVTSARSKKSFNLARITDAAALKSTREDIERYWQAAIVVV